MKILILGRTLSEFHGTSSFHLYRAIAEACDCVFYGYGFEKEKAINVGDNERDVLKIVNKEKPDVIWVQWYWSTKPEGDWKNLSKLRGRIPLLSNAGDPWARLIQKASFNKTYVDLVLLDSGLPNHPLWGGHWKDFPAVLFHAGVNTEVYKPLGLSRIYDVGVFGARNPTFYPIRNYINGQLSRRRNIKVFNPPLLSGTLSSTQGYVRAINECKMMICTGEMFSSINLPYICFTHKYIEGMACKTMILGQIPADFKQLHFRTGCNIVSVDRGNFLEKILYYREHEDERLNMVKQGYETVLKYHTIKKRAKQFVGICKVLMENYKDRTRLMDEIKERNYTYENF